MPGYARFISCCAVLLILAAAPSQAQYLTDYSEFYRLMRINAAEQLVFCHSTSSPESEPLAYGVLRDSLGRAVRITRFMFGNPDSRGDWATMRIEYSRFDTVRTELQRRTFYNVNGTPLMPGNIHAEEVISRIDGPLLMRKLVDREGKPVNGPGDVSRVMYRAQEPGRMMQEWYYGNGKLHYGTGSDGPFRPFAPMPPGAYYRLIDLDENGNLVREEIRDFDKRPIRFPGGEKVRVYELNDCGQPTRVIFVNTLDEPMPDSSGVAYKTFEYDDAGRLVEWRAYGPDGEPRGRREDGVAGARYVIREFDGVFLREERFNEEGDLLP